MRLIDRYLLREFLFWLVVFFRRISAHLDCVRPKLRSAQFQQAHLRGKDIIEYYFFEIPEFVPIALPVSILLAMLYALTNHARHNEMTAIRAAGVSLVRLCMPYFGAGFFFSVLLFAFNEYFAPQAGDKADEIIAPARRRQIERRRNGHLVKPLNFVNYGIGGKGRTWSAPVYNTETFEMTKPLVAWAPTNGQIILLSATTAVWTNQTGSFRLRSGKLRGNRECSARCAVLATNYLAMPDFRETPAEIQSDIKVNAFRNRLLTKTHRADIPLSDIVNYLRFHPQPDRKMRNWLFTKLHGRFAGPFACLVCVIVAIPFSARSGRRNIFVGVAASIFIFFIYFVLQQVGLTFGETGWIPSWLGAWFPICFSASAGCFSCRE